MNKKATRSVKIGGKHVGDGHKTFFIAEIGNNHNGDYFLAKKSIEEAVKSGADAVKFQKRIIDEVFTKELQNQPQIKDQVYGKTYGEYRRKLELSEEDLMNLKKLADELGIIFFATPFDKKSADMLERIGVGLYKIASFDCTNLPLLEHVARKGKPMILSAGMATLKETDLAVKTVLQHNDQLILMHCVSMYPTSDERLNLSVIPFLRERYSPLPVGYSGHEGDALPSVASVVLGANIIERHFTLDKRLPGPDHATVSLEPQEFKAMVENVRRIEQALGTPEKVIYEEEKKSRDKHSKSIVSKQEIPAGTVITETMITYKSPGYGFKPYEIGKVVGTRAKVNIPEDTVITKEHLSSV